MVTPLVSSIICAVSRVLDLYIERRGRISLPITLARTRLWRRILCCVFESSIVFITVRGVELRGGCGGRLLTLLLTHDLAFVADTLALVRLRLLHGAYGCGELADRLLIGTRNGNDVLLDDRRDAFRNGEHNGVRESDRELQLLARELNFVADTLYLQFLDKRCVDARNHVANVCGVRAPQRAAEARLLFRRNGRLTVCDSNRDGGVDHLLECAALPLDHEL